MYYKKIPMAGIEFKIEADTTDFNLKLDVIKEKLREIEKIVDNLKAKGIDLDLIIDFINVR